MEIKIDLENSNTNRKCGQCTLCCKLLPVREVNKAANTKCRHQSTAKGCAVYRKPGRFPLSCAAWSCQWLTEAHTAKLKRPDRSGYVIDMMPDLIVQENNKTGEKTETMVLQVWIDPARPNAWRDPELGVWINERGMPALLRFGSARAIAAFPPSTTPDNKWYFVESGEIVASKTGSRLLDLMEG